ncbi:hypothetical protein GF359_09600 [candidate division WOR-3 bacterium]|uniref:OmpH family outer membrane protein n=1 Tax=candidate division WOR-3 bacterium TaxID=2052148 RepID=A0A9D5KAT8_UNCW3|nr:hypothetical protein [candidate division WOR-3 bacterium]MBD3365453.1 hypothetical protein [candidate division WOR-3 bacterium]
MGNKTIAIILGVVSMLCGIEATTVVVVDLEEVLNDFEDAKLADKTLKHSVKIWEQEFDSLRTVYEEEKAEFETQKPMLSEEALLARQQELTSMRDKWENYAQEVWGEGGRLEQKHKELFDPVMEKVNKIIKEVSQENEAEMVIDGSGGDLLYLNAELDITNEVITELNREYASVGARFDKKIAVLTFSQSGEEAISASLGDSVRGYVKTTVGQSEDALDIELVKDEVVRPILVDQWGKSFTGLEPLSPEQAMTIAGNFGADYAFTGNVTKEGGRIEVELTLSNVSTRNFFTEETTISEEEEAYLKQHVGELAAELLQIHIIPEGVDEAESGEEEEPREEIPEETPE